MSGLGGLLSYRQSCGILNAPSSRHFNVGYCVHCHKQVDASWQFCPFCGADNRPPESQPHVPVHTHDFSKGYHCILCGEARTADARQTPTHGMVYRSYRIMLILLGVGAWLVLAGLVGGGRQPLSPGVRLVFQVLGGICLVGGALFQQKALIDLDRKEVRSVIGVWPLPVVRVHPFRECTTVMSDVRVSYRKYGGVTYYYQIKIAVSSGNPVLVKEFRDPDDAFNIGLLVADTIGVQFQNLSTGVAW